MLSEHERGRHPQRMPAPFLVRGRRLPKFAAQNWVDSVDSAIATVDEAPPETVLATASK